MLRKMTLMLAASAAAVVMAAGFAAAQDTLKIGASAPKTGPLAGGAAVTHWPNIKLWIEEVNERGGLKVGGKQMKVELIEYDDKTSGEEAVKNIQRLATVDKVDFIVTPYSTGLNVATAPLIARYGYPHITTSAATDNVPEFAKRWPNSFWLLGTSKQLAEGVADALKKLRDSGAIGKRVALVNVADAFGLELLNAGKPALQKAGFEIVYEASYPLGTQDVAPIISAAKAANPDAFVAFSYPPDTFALTEQAQIQKFDVGAFYVGVGTAFPGYAARFKDDANGVMGVGGIDPELEGDSGLPQEAQGSDGRRCRFLGERDDLCRARDSRPGDRARRHDRQGRGHRRDQEEAVQDRDRRGQSRGQHQPQGLDRRPVAGRLVQRRRVCRHSPAPRLRSRKSAWK